MENSPQKSTKKGGAGFGALVVVGFLVTGTGNVVLTKLMYGISAEGRFGRVHKFEKPWLLTAAMFVGMALTLVGYFVARLCTRGPKKPIPRKVWYVIIGPAVCDAASTLLQGVGLLWISGSVWQMLRGAILIFTALFTVTYRRKRLTSSEWMGVSVVLLALVVVGASSFVTPGEIDPSAASLSSQLSSSSGSEDQQQPVWRIALGICLVVGAQLLQALQTVIEESLLHDVDADPLLLVGLEGVYGLVLCTVSMVAAQFMPGAEGNGLREDTIDSFIMISHSWLLAGLVAGSVVFVLLFNITGMVITSLTSAMTRNILEPVRTLLVWVVMIALCYIFTRQTMGERVNLWSLLELGGFAMLSFGVLVHNGVIRLRCLKYPPKEEEEASPLLHEETVSVGEPQHTSSGHVQY